MKVTIPQPVQVEISTIRIQLPVRYGEEDIPNNFPLRVDDVWIADVDIDTGKIKDWPEGQTGDLHMKVCDSGHYTLFEPGGARLAGIEDYVPHGVVPGEYGDYVILKINESGVIAHWPKRPDVSAFFGKEEE